MITNIEDRETDSNEESISGEETQKRNTNVDDGVSDDVEILNTKWSQGSNPTLFFKCQYDNCQPMWISFEDMKIDCPNATTIYIVSRKIGGQNIRHP